MRIRRIRLTVIFIASFLFAEARPLSADLYLQSPRGSINKTWIGSFSKLQGWQMPILRPQEPCYDYAFVSTREGNGEHIFFANTCSSAVKRSTPAIGNPRVAVSYKSLSGSQTSHEVAVIATYRSEDPEHPGEDLVSEYLETWNYRGVGSLPHDSTRGEILVQYPAWGPSDTIAVATTNRSGDNDGIGRIPRPLPAGYTGPVPIASELPFYAESVGRIAWIPVNDPADAGYGKLIVSLRLQPRDLRFGSGDIADRPFLYYVDRLYVVDVATGQFHPLIDPLDTASGGGAMGGLEPAVSHDGKHIAFIRNSGGLNLLWTCDLQLAPIDPSTEEGSNFCNNVRRIDAGFLEPESEEGNYAWPCWSRDSKKIFFSYDGFRRGTDDVRYQRVYMANPDGSGRKQLPATGEETDASYPACLPIQYELLPSRTETMAPFQPAQTIRQAPPTIELAPYRTAPEESEGVPVPPEEEGTPPPPPPKDCMSNSDCPPDYRCDRVMGTRMGTCVPH